MVEPGDERILIYYTREKARDILGTAVRDMQKVADEFQAQSEAWTHPDSEHPGVWTPREPWTEAAWDLYSEFVRMQMVWAETVRDLQAAFLGGAELIGVYRPLYSLTAQDIRESDMLYLWHTASKDKESR